MQIPDDLSSDDVTALSLGLYHMAKSKAVRTAEPGNSVEDSLTEQADDHFSTYLVSMRESVRILTEKM